jgi:hypothetical protein
MRMKDIHAQVEELIGRQVSRSAVKNWLANHVQVIRGFSFAWGEAGIS